MILCLNECAQEVFMFQQYLNYIVVLFFSLGSCLMASDSFDYSKEKKDFPISSKLSEPQLEDLLIDFREKYKQFTLDKQNRTLNPTTQKEYLRVFRAHFEGIIVKDTSYRVFSVWSPLAQLIINAYGKLSSELNPSVYTVFNYDREANLVYKNKYTKFIDRALSALSE